METKEDSIIDNIIKGQWDSILNSNSIDISNVYGNVIQSAIELQKEIDRYKDKDTKGLLTIKNPENLNTHFGYPNAKFYDWNITYVGRDLSLTEDNYRWDIANADSRIRGYYIIERELINDGDWVYVRWGRLPVSSKERREVINKSRLKDKDRIRKDMVSVIENSVR